jgi:hypothetical protein
MGSHVVYRFLSPPRFPQLYPRSAYSLTFSMVAKRFYETLLKAVTYLPDYMELHPRRRLSTQSPPFGPIIVTPTRLLGTGIVTGCGLDYREVGVRFPVGSRPALGSTRPPIQ